MKCSPTTITNSMEKSPDESEPLSGNSINSLPRTELTAPQNLTQTQTQKRQPYQSLAVVPSEISFSSPTKRIKQDPSFFRALPLKYELCPMKDLVILISNMIQELISTNDKLPPRSNVLTRFHSRTPPGISVFEYLQRLAKHTTLTPPLLLSMVYYIDQLCLLYPDFIINSLTVHRFLITACTVASKGLSDAFLNNATYARVGGINFSELGLLELDFLYRLDWKIIPNSTSLVKYYRGLVARSGNYKIEDEELPVQNNTYHNEEKDLKHPRTRKSVNYGNESQIEIAEIIDSKNQD
ncbi:hypothetical protein Golomagni_03145 [Golovinomyces magnicellulatus]|nr:hypothetical protein Golomagni_03145 [Golovinomyces magnicellulatus]